MDKVGLHIVKQPLVMGDEQDRLVRLAHDAVDAVADHTQRIDVEAAVGFVEDGKAGVDNAHLHHLVPLLFAAGKADIHRTLQHVHIHAERARLFARDLQELGARKRGFTAMLALRVQGLAQELHVRHTGDFNRILEAKKQPGRGALMRLHAEQVFAVEGDRPFGHFITGPTRQHIAERRFARAVGAHDRMNLARVQGQVQALEDRLVGDSGVEVSYLKHHDFGFILVVL